MSVLQNLPTEMLIHILNLLPSKTLLQLKSLNKTWYSLLTNPTFITSLITHKITTTTNNPKSSPPLFLSEGFDHQYSIWQKDQNFDHRTFLNCPPTIKQAPVSDFTTCGTCNGLACLFSDLGQVLLWNPSIRKHIQLEPLTVKPFESALKTVGFGFASETNDYKVVAIQSAYKPYHAHVYSLNSGSWKSVDFPNWVTFTHASKSQAFANGVIHWIISNGAVVVVDGCSDEGFLSVKDLSVSKGAVVVGDCCSDEGFLSIKDLSVSILTFDANSEVFGELDLPSGLDQVNHQNISVTVIKNSLGLVHGFHEICDVFIMDNHGGRGTWVRLFSVKLPGPCLRVFCLINASEMLMMLKGGVVACLDTTATDQGYRTYQSYADGYLENGYISDETGCAFPLFESLVLIDKFSKSPWSEGTYNLEDNDAQGCRMDVEKGRKRRCM